MRQCAQPAAHFDAQTEPLGEQSGERVRRRLVAVRLDLWELPQPQHLIQRGAGEGLHVGEGAHEPPEVGNHGRDLGLLEHDLRDPDAVEVPRPPPGEIAAVPVEPGEKARSDLQGERPAGVTTHRPALLHDEIVEVVLVGGA